MYVPMYVCNAPESVLNDTYGVRQGRGMDWGSDVPPPFVAGTIVTGHLFSIARSGRDVWSGPPDLECISLTLEVAWAYVYAVFLGVRGTQAARLKPSDGRMQPQEQFPSLRCTVTSLRAWTR